MATDLSIAYVDRTDGRLHTEQVYAHSFLNWSYNTSAGWAITAGLLSHPLVSRFYGWTQRRSASKHRIRPFVERFHINRAELTRPLESYKTFAEFFTREIDMTFRPVDNHPQVCISPVDGKAMAYQSVSARTVLQIKRHKFNLEQLLRDSRLAQRYNGGAVVVLRLCLADYHHFHFPDSGTPGATTIINGSLFAGGPYALRRWVPFYQENLRACTVFDSDHFGRIVMVEVGAFTVGSIRQCFTPAGRIAKGDRKGYFELGGSTVVLLFKPGAIHFDNDLLANTRRGLETQVKMGERIGRKG